MDDVRTASIRGAGLCHIYVGVFGEKYSPLTIDEYATAVKKRKPCLTYVKRSRRRAPQLASFVTGELKNRFKYYEFRSVPELIDQIERDLSRLLSRLLHEGLSNMAEAKATAAKIEEGIRPKDVGPIDPAEAEQILVSAEEALQASSYVEAVTLSFVVIELSLSELLRRERGELKRPLTLGAMIRIGGKTGILSAEMIRLIRKLQYIRNRLVHVGSIPKEKEASMFVSTARRLLESLRDPD